MADPKFQISNPKGMTKSDFESLQGTSLYVRMFKNRCFIKIVGGGMNSVRDAARKEIEEWLRANCNTLYYFPAGELHWVYIEGAADAVNFKMRFHDEDVTIPEPPAPPQPRTPPSRRSLPPPPAARPAKMTPEDFRDWKGLFERVNATKGYNSDPYSDIIDSHDDVTIDKVFQYLHDSSRTRRF